MAPVKREADDDNENAPARKRLRRRTHKQVATSKARSAAQAALIPASMSIPACEIVPEQVEFRAGRFDYHFKLTYTFTDLIRVHANNIEHYFARALAYEPEHAERQTGYSRERWTSLIETLERSGFTRDRLREMVETEKHPADWNTRNQTQRKRWRVNASRKRTDGFPRLRELLRTFDAALLTLEAKPDDMNDAHPRQIKLEPYVSDEEESEEEGANSFPSELVLKDEIS